MKFLFFFATASFLLLAAGCNDGNYAGGTTKSDSDSSAVKMPAETGDSIYMIELSVEYARQVRKELKNKIDSSGLAKIYQRDFLDSAAVNASGGAIIEALRYVFYAKLNSGQMQALQKDNRIDTVRPYKLIPYSFPAAIKCTPATELQWNVKAVWKASHPDGNYKTAWILDTGVDPAHTDLNIGMSKTFVTGVKPDDAHGHGTHMAGIIGAKANGKGVVGVAPNALLNCFKIYNDKTELDPKAYHKTLEYVLTNAAAGDVLNLSMEGEGADATEKKYIMDIAAKKIFVVIAAGNKKEDVENKIYPATINGTNIYTVSASEKTATYSSFSNFGKVSLDYSAPGEEICSTWKSGGHMSDAGTSQAAAHLSGLLLLTKGKVSSVANVKKDPDGKADPIIHE